MKKMSRRSREVMLLILALGCFAILGFVSQMTAPLSQNFDKAFVNSDFHAMDLRPQLYALLSIMTIPAALMSRYLGARACMLMGTCLFAGGALSTLPAAQVGSIGPLAIGISIVYTGLAFIDTASMTIMATYGERQKSYGRMLVGKTSEMAGWAMGFAVTIFSIERRTIAPPLETGSISESLYLLAAQRADLMAAATPFVWVGSVAGVIALVTALQEANDSTPDPPHKYKLKEIVRSISRDKVFILGAVALVVYIMTQVFCWHSIVTVSTAVELNSAPDVPTSKATEYAQNMILLTLLFFCLGRIVVIPYAYRNKINPQRLLAWASGVSAVLTFLSIFVPREVGMWFIIVATTSMSLIFPTIVEIATRHMDRETVVIAMPIAVISNFGGLLAWVVNKWFDADGPVKMIITTIALGGIAAYAIWLKKNMRKPAPNDDFFKTHSDDEP